MANDNDIIINEVVLPIVAKTSDKYKVLKALLDRYKVKYSYLKRGDTDYIDDSIKMDYLDLIDERENENE